MDKSILICFENRTLSDTNLKLLKKSEFNLARLTQSEQYPTITRPLDHEYRPSDSDLQLHGPVSAPRFLFELRDYYFNCYQSRYNLSLLCYGGSATYVMPQYYIFKKLLKNGDSCHIYVDENREGLGKLISQLIDGSFDGRRHNFTSCIDLGFPTMMELVEHPND